MDNIAPALIDPSELPDGFSSSDPNAGAGGGGGASSSHASEQQAKQAAVAQQRESVLEQALTADALARLRRIKMVKEQKAKSVENAIVNLAMSGKLPGPITEGKLIEMLERGNASSATARSNSTNTNGGSSSGGGGGGPGSIQIQRKNYGKMDSSDDDDDNDDDL
jgi:programmed cell death protein 5